jgi:hypothetical protein
MHEDLAIAGGPRGTRIPGRFYDGTFEFVRSSGIDLI